MKDIICIVCALLLGYSLQGQQSNCLEANGVSTDPANPVNNQLGGIAINNFDWMQEYFTITFSCDHPQQQDSVESPFYNHANTNSEYLVSYMPNIVAADYLPEDGWELLNLTNEINQFSMILYNKYTSIIRVLSSIPRCGSDFGTLQMSLGFDDPEGEVTGLLATAGA